VADCVRALEIDDRQVGVLALEDVAPAARPTEVAADAAELAAILERLAS